MQPIQGAAELGGQGLARLLPGAIDQVHDQHSRLGGRNHGGWFRRGLGYRFGRHRAGPPQQESQKHNRG